MNTKIIATAIIASAATSMAATNITHLATPSQVPDASQPRVNYGDAPAGFGPDSWQDSETNKVNWHARYSTDGNYLTTLFPTQAATLKISDIASISYNVKSSSEHWFLKIYTRPLDGEYTVKGEGDNASWYSQRFTNNYTDITADGTWRTWSTSDVGAVFNDDFSTPDNMTWADMQTEWGDHLIEMISVQTDSASGTAGFMDGLVITLNDGSVGTVNFVPEPASLGLLGLAGMLISRRSRA